MSLNLLVWFYAFTHPFNVFSFVTNFNYILATWCRKPWYFKIINLVWSKIFEISNVYNISCFKDIEIRNSKFVPSNQLLFRIIIQINFTFIRNKKNCIWTALGHTQNTIGVSFLNHLISWTWKYLEKNWFFNIYLNFFCLKLNSFILYPMFLISNHLHRLIQIHCGEKQWFWILLKKGNVEVAI